MRMEENGLVLRRQKEGNRRSLYVSLTEKGKQSAEKLMDIFNEAENMAVSNMTDEEIKVLKETLCKLCDTIKINNESKKDIKMSEIKHQKINHPFKRLLFLCLGLIIMAFGVAFSIKAALGTSPISSVPYVTSKISGLSVGTTTIIMNFIFVLIQIAILNKDYDCFQLLQLPAAVLFGTMIDVAEYDFNKYFLHKLFSTMDSLCYWHIFNCFWCKYGSYGKNSNYSRGRYCNCYM